MRKTLLFIALSLSLPFLTDAQEAALDKVTKQTCECMSSKELTTMERDQFEQELGLCMLTAATPLLADIEKEEGIGTGDPEMFQKVGEKVGAKLAASCPDLFNKMIEIYADEGDFEGETEVRQVFLAEGKFVGIGQEQFTHLQLKTADGNTTKYLWLQAFEGSEALQNNAATMVGKSLKVFYEEQDFYQAKTKNYITMKILRKVELN